MGKHVTTTIRYDGSELVNHQMDVQELAPALLALAEMAQLTNKRFNGDAVSMNVLVKADIEQHCFQLDIHLVQNILETAKQLFDTDNFKTAKEIAEILGFVSGGMFSIWTIWKKASEKFDTNPITISTTQHDGLTTIVYGSGSSPITVNNNTYSVAIDPAMIELGKKVLKPLECAGYDTVGFYPDNKPTVEWSEEEARNFIKLPTQHINPDIDPKTDLNVTSIRTFVSVKTQRNDGKARWEIKWANKAVWVSIEDFDWLHRFQSGQIHVDIPYKLDVSLEMTTSKTNPNLEPTYAIKEVHELINPPARQESLL